MQVGSRLSGGVCALALLSLSTAVAAAQGETVQIGGEHKAARGKLLSATAGDVACYLDFEHANGDRFSEMASFEWCEETNLQGKWVQIGYSMESVLADSCQGNPDCSESQSVALVTSLQAADPSDSAAASTETDPDPGSGQYRHCGAHEATLFNCVIGSRVLSVCSSGEPELQSVEYRYGKAGETLEMCLPKRAGVPNPTVYGRTEMFAGGGGAWIRFRNGNVAYVVYGGIGRWGEGGATMEKNGVVIEQPNKQVVLECDTPPINEFSPEFFERMGADPGSAEEFYFPD